MNKAKHIKYVADKYVELPLPIYFFQVILLKNTTICPAYKLAAIFLSFSVREQTIFRTATPVAIHICISKQEKMPLEPSSNT